MEEDLKPRSSIAMKRLSSHDEDTGSLASTLVPNATTGRTLDLSYDSWKCTGANITDTGTSANLYNVSWSIRKPLHLSVNSVDTHKPIADIAYHMLRTRIDVKLHDQSFEIRPHHLISKNYSYASPALEGATLTWQYSGSATKLELVCLDEKGVALAKVYVKPWSMKNFGRMEFWDDRASAFETVIEEVIVTGLAVTEQWICATTGDLGGDQCYWVRKGFMKISSKGDRWLDKLE